MLTTFTSLFSNHFLSLQRATSTFLLILAILLLLSPLSSAEDAVQKKYIGATVCEMCHHVQYQSWSSKPHGKAFEALKPGKSLDVKRAAGLDPMKDYTDDSKCLKCHTTGYRKQGGFLNLKNTPNMVNVQCESCHGAGNKYVEKVMRRKFSFAHAEVDDLGHIGYSTLSHAHSPTKGGRPRPSHEHEQYHSAKNHTDSEKYSKADRYGYNILGDPPPTAHRHEGKTLPLDATKASYCTETCHNEESPTYQVSGIKDFAATFEKQVSKGIHRRYGLMFIHW